MHGAFARRCSAPSSSAPFLGLRGERRASRARGRRPRPADADRRSRRSRLKRFAEALDAARAFVAAHPDHKFAHSALYLAAQSAYDLAAFDAVLAEADRFVDDVYEFRVRIADRLAVRRAQARFEAARAGGVRPASTRSWP